MVPFIRTVNSTRDFHLFNIWSLERKLKHSLCSLISVDLMLTGVSLILSLLEFLWSPLHSQQVYLVLSWICLLPKESLSLEVWFVSKLKFLRLCFDLSSFSMTEAIGLKFELILVLNQLSSLIIQVFCSKCFIKGHPQVLW